MFQVYSKMIQLHVCVCVCVCVRAHLCSVMSDSFDPLDEE